MFDVDNRIDIIDFRTLTSIYFVQNGVVIQSFKCDETNKRSDLKKVAKHIRTCFNFNFARIEIKRKDKNIQKTIKSLKRAGIVITDIKETRIY